MKDQRRSLILQTLFAVSISLSITTFGSADVGVYVRLAPEFRLTPADREATYRLEAFGEIRTDRFFIGAGGGGASKSRIAVDEILLPKLLDKFVQLDRAYYIAFGTEGVAWRSQVEEDTVHAEAILGGFTAYRPGVGFIGRYELIETYLLGDNSSSDWYTDSTIYVGLYYMGRNYVALRGMLGTGTNERLDRTISNQLVKPAAGGPAVTADLGLFPRTKLRFDFWTPPVWEFAAVKRLRVFFTLQREWPNDTELQIRLPDDTVSTVKRLNEVTFNIGLEINLNKPSSE